MLFSISFYLGKSKVVFLPEGLIGYVKPESKVSCLKTIWGTAWVGFVCGRQKKVVRASKQDFHHGLCNTTKHQGLDSMQWQFIETTRSDEEWIWRESCPPADKWQSLIMVCWPAHNSKTTTRGRSKESKFFKSFIITLCQRRSWPYCTTCLPTFCPFVWASQGIGKHHKYVPVCAVLIVKLQKDIGPYAKLNFQHTRPKPWSWQNPEADKSSEVILAQPIRPSGREYGTNLQSFIWSYILKNVHHVLLWTVNWFF